MHRRNFTLYLKNIFLLQLFVAAILIGWSLDWSQQNQAAWSIPSLLHQEESLFRIRINERLAQSLIGSVNCAMAGDTDIEYLSRAHLGRQFAKNMFTSSINALAYSKDSSEEALARPSKDYRDGKDIQLPAIRLEAEEKAAPELLERAKDQGIFFYCTHSTETYIPDSGQARLKDRRGLVNEVAVSMAALLNKKGLKAEHIDTIHDWPEYNQSYTNSRNTVKKLVDDEGILALFDVHRDSIPGSTQAATIKVNGRKSAVILIVVGSDERKDHPHWKENLAFAQKIYQQGQLMYPGLIKGVRTKAGTYNQEYHRHALLLEMGSDYNSWEEAQYAGELFTNVLVEVLEKEVR
ncbi:MAG: stage II sporulation protein P [Syntrophomonadaceae bacterium]|jgi:stage II sporulation protein P|nr:stage II sporulation protein P [Syntrophomonadaceae bacterium]